MCSGSVRFEPISTSTGPENGPSAWTSAAVEMEPIPGAPGKRGYQALQQLFFEENMVVRISGDTIVLIPALIASESEIGRMVDGVRAVLNRLD